MGLASKGFVKAQVNAVDSKYAELITSGTHRQGVWNAATNTPTLSPNSGTNGFWYDVSVEGDWDGRHWRVGDKIIFNSATNKWDQIPTGVEKDDQPMLIGFINENSSFPTTRPSGKPLLVGDYLKVDSAAVLPFDIDDGTGTKILFDSYMDEAEWNGSRFQEKSYKAGMTNEVGVKSPTEESISEEAVYQNQVNKEFKERLKNIGEFVNVGNSFENVEKNEKFLYYLEEDWEPKEWTGLKFTSQQNGSTVGYNITGTVNKDIYYSTDGKNWTTWDGSNITLNNGESIYVWNKTNTLSTSDSNYLNFTMSGLISASGNVNSMINFSELTPYCYTFMFHNCSSLTTAPELPATSLTHYCYYYMFYGCTSLTTAPELPAMTLVEGCYYNMFTGCTSLITAPELPAMNLAKNCYRLMFYKCTSITIAPELPATTLSEDCYFGMFQKCSSLTNAPELPAMNLAICCYYNMFAGCTSLITAPELPAMNLAIFCYYRMFADCSSLTTAPYLPATTLFTDCYQLMFAGCTNINTIKISYTGEFGIKYFNNWVENVSSSGTLYYNGSDTTRGYSAIPKGWTVEQFSQNGGE